MMISGQTSLTHWHVGPIIEPLHDDVIHLKKTDARPALWDCSGVADRLSTRKIMTEALVLFLEVDIKCADLQEKVVDKNTREALRRWISCRCLNRIRG